MPENLLKSFKTRHNVPLQTTISATTMDVLEWVVGELQKKDPRASRSSVVAFVLETNLRDINNLPPKLKEKLAKIPAPPTC